MSELAPAITALATLIASIATLIAVLKSLREVEKVHTEVKTANGITLAALADRQEGRRIEETIPHRERTPAETGYVEMLEEGGRNVGHE